MWRPIHKFAASHRSSRWESPRVLKARPRALPQGVAQVAAPRLVLHIPPHREAVLRGGLALAEGEWTSSN